MRVVYLCTVAIGCRKDILPIPTSAIIIIVITIIIVILEKSSN